jgi:hypothetical protein
MNLVLTIAGASSSSLLDWACVTRANVFVVTVVVVFLVRPGKQLILIGERGPSRLRCRKRPKLLEAVWPV